MDEKNLASIRRENLRKWMADREIKASDLAAAIGSGRAYASLLFREDRHFGEKAARNIETKMRMPEGYLDRVTEGPMAVQKWTETTGLDPAVIALVPRIDMVYCADKKLVIDVPQQLPPMAFTPAWLASREIQSREGLRFCSVSGDSMEPLLNHGDLVMVDRGQSSVVDGESYAIQYGDQIRVRILFRTIDGGVRLHALNSKFPDEVVPAAGAKGFAILGRRVWRGG